MTTVMMFIFITMLTGPALALLVHVLPGGHHKARANKACQLMGLSFLASLGLLCSKEPIQHLSLIDNTSPLNTILCCLVLGVSFVVHRFSWRYMDGDRQYRRYFTLLAALTFTVMIMTLADHTLLFVGAWFVSNLLLVLLMIHKKQWVAAKHSGLLALLTLLPGSIALLLALIILSSAGHSQSMQELLSNPETLPESMRFIAASLIVIAGLTQSALWPFHRWLISSLNSPTPVSALMHAGLVNGGGVLIVKFAPLMLLHPDVLTALFILGAISALMGTLWKLVQSDIKRMLACSTMAQMGFMMMQCGLGLFAAAIAHLCWHGCFKAYLFLTSGSAVAHKKNKVESERTGLLPMILSLGGGFAAMSGFAYITQKNPMIIDASSLTLFFAFIAGAQLMLSLLQQRMALPQLLAGVLMAGFGGLMYGCSVHLIEWLLPQWVVAHAIAVTPIHGVILSLFALLWVAFNLGYHQKLARTSLGARLYMSLLNGSQPSPKTITAVRTQYDY